ncbi:hypothetical protein C0J52_06589 [Blattella germanica]|nr:hypothetical protein C0J52_06589 [Blattella germanica]
MYTAVRSSAEKWSGDKVTLRQLQDLFAPPSDDSNNTSDESSNTSDEKPHTNTFSHNVCEETNPSASCSFSKTQDNGLSSEASVSHSDDLVSNTAGIPESTSTLPNNTSSGIDNDLDELEEGSLMNE